jgi:prolyl 4-hydroxylase
VDVWYDDGGEGTYQGQLKLGQEYTVNSYEGHVFYFTEQGNRKKEVSRHHITASRVLYTIEDPSRPPPKHMKLHQEKEEQFMAEYYNRTGIQWRHFYGPEGPRKPPILYMHPAEYVGQVHSVPITEAKWTCRAISAECHSPVSEPCILNLTVLSTHPKAFLIEGFLSDVEVDAIVDTAAPRMHISYVGNKDAGGARKSETRTSRNAWLDRDSNEFTETLYKRAEELLKIDKLDRENAEDMQVVHYVNGQRYDSHHDWGVSGYPESRYITLLLYLNDMADEQAGGETSFPKGKDGQPGFKIHPGKGNAVLFYSLLEDGNGDDLSLHAALPVLRGEKWLANFWVWDPKRR